MDPSQLEKTLFVLRIKDFFFIKGLALASTTMCQKPS
jgi:hypothetical protein